MPMEWTAYDLLTSNHQSTEALKQTTFISGSFSNPNTTSSVNSRDSVSDSFCAKRRKPKISVYRTMNDFRHFPAVDTSSVNLDQVRSSPHKDMSGHSGTPSPVYLTVNRPYKLPNLQPRSPTSPSEAASQWKPDREPSFPADDCGSPSISSGSAEPCQVCGQRASGNFFGAMVCLPCKSFFIRCTKDGDPVFVPQCDGHCDVSKQGRNRCQHCRYERCLAAGMSRKEKPEAIEPGEGQLLCRVCGDIANGIHFGVYTCEGCKKFFRRGLLEYQSYVCKGSMQCVLNPRNRNNCRYCRFQKCLFVGMSRGAIKMGRPKKVVKDHEFNPMTVRKHIHRMDNYESDSLELPSVSTVKAYSDLNVNLASSESSSSVCDETYESSGYLSSSSSTTSYLPLKKCILRSLLAKEEALAQQSEAEAKARKEKETLAKYGDGFHRQHFETSSDDALNLIVGKKFSLVAEDDQLSPCGSDSRFGYSLAPKRHVVRSKSYSPSSCTPKRSYVYLTEDDRQLLKRRKSDNHVLDCSHSPCSENDFISIDIPDLTAGRKVLSQDKDKKVCVDLRCQMNSPFSSMEQEPPVPVGLASDENKVRIDSSYLGREDNKCASLTADRQILSPESSLDQANTTESPKRDEQFSSNSTNAQSLPAGPGKVSSWDSSEEGPGLPNDTLVTIGRSTLNDLDQLFIKSLSTLESIQKRTMEQEQMSNSTLDNTSSEHNASTPPSQTLIPLEFKDTAERLERGFSFPPVTVCEYWNNTKALPNDRQMNSEHHTILMDMLEAYMEMLRNLDETHLPPAETFSHIKDWPTTECAPILQHVFKRILRQVREEVYFMNKVPGFKDFHPKDRAFIIHNFCFTNVTLMATRDWYNAETECFRNMMSWELKEGHPMYNFRLNAKLLANKVEEVKMDRTEAAMLSALNVAAADVSILENRSVIEKSREKLVAALAAHLHGKGVDPEKRMKELFQLMPAFRICGFWTRRQREEINLFKDKLEDRKVNLDKIVTETRKDAISV